MLRSFFQAGCLSDVQWASALRNIAFAFPPVVIVGIGTELAVFSGINRARFRILRRIQRARFFERLSSHLNRGWTSCVEFAGTSHCAAAAMAECRSPAGFSIGVNGAFEMMGLGPLRRPDRILFAVVAISGCDFINRRELIVLHVPAC